MKKNVMIYNNPLQPNHQKNKQKKKRSSEIGQP